MKDYRKKAVDRYNSLTAAENGCQYILQYIIDRSKSDSS